MLVLTEQTDLLDLAGPFQALTIANELAEGGASYELIVASHAGGLVRLASGLAIETCPLDAQRRVIDTILAPGGDSDGSQALVDWLRTHAPLVRRVCGIGAGTALLARAGLLSGRRAAIHWKQAEILRAEHPDIDARAEEIVVNDGRYWTSAGMSAGVDLALALIAEDLGRATAMDVARRLIVFLWRPADSPQLSPSLNLQARGISRFSDLHAWIMNNPCADLRVEALAARMAMSPRTFARIYIRETGTTPAKAVEAIRLDLARRLLHSAVPIKRIAEQCGFKTELNLRRVFHRHFGISPADYRSGDMPLQAE